MKKAIIAKKVPALGTIPVTKFIFKNKLVITPVKATANINYVDQSTVEIIFNNPVLF